ncbi:hypothetical protein [Devosia epidermidihirudinis]|nr:hypothetical protein [Devosia epidermidihirudinis]
MNVRSLLSVAAILSSMALPSLAFAQDAHMISGKAVPADQVAEVQAKCDELRAAPPAADAMAAAPAADKTAGWMADGAKIDLTKLTVALCDEGKFVATKK